jgi:hypothetical protein
VANKAKPVPDGYHIITPCLSIKPEGGVLLLLLQAVSCAQRISCITSPTRFCSTMSPAHVRVIL